MPDYRTKTNPSGEVRQCRERHIHQPHEYQGDFGAYFNVFCPGNDGKKKEEDDDFELPPYVQVERTDILVRCNRCGAVVEGDVGGQVIHNVWHDNETRRIREQSGVYNIF